MKQREILMVRRATDKMDGVEPETLYLKKIVSSEELGLGFWLVHDLEDSCWYVVDPISGLAVVREETRTAAKEAFDAENTPIRRKAWNVRFGSWEYEWAVRRLHALQIRPIWDPNEESEEDFSSRLAHWSEEQKVKEKQWRYSPQGIEKAVLYEFAPEKDEK